MSTAWTWTSMKMGIQFDQVSTHTHPSSQVSKRCPSFVHQFWVQASEENGFQHKCHIFFWSFTWIFPSSVFWFVSFVYTLHVLYNNVVGCPCTASKCRGLSFHGLPKDVIGTKTNQEWRSQLVHAINHANSSFNPDKAKICSRHFTEDCFRYMVSFVMFMTLNIITRCCVSMWNKHVHIWPQPNYAVASNDDSSSNPPA